MRNGLLLLLVILSACSSPQRGGDEADWSRVWWSPVTVRDFALLDDGVVLAATSNGVLRSEGDPSEWEIVKEGIPSPRDITSITAVPGSPAAYASTSEGYIVRTIDAGESWDVAGFFGGEEILDLAADLDGRLWVASSRGLYLEGEEDLAGTRINPPRRLLLPFETLILGIPVSRRIQGDTMDEDAFRLIDRPVIRVAVHPDDPSLVLAEIMDEGLYIVGDTFVPCVTTEGERVVGPVAFEGDYITTGNYSSHDRGIHWERTGLEPDDDDLGQIHDDDFYVHDIVRSGGMTYLLQMRVAAVYESENNGESWSRIAGPEDFGLGRRGASVLGIEAFGNQGLLVATSGKGIYLRRGGPLEAERDRI